MSSLNQCTFIGNVGKIETRYAPNGDAICNMSVAVNESWKDRNTGEKKEATEWVRATAFGKLGEICSQYLKVGKQVFIQGKMKTRKYTDKDGVERYSTDIVLDEMKMLGGRDDGDSAPRSNDRQQQRQSSQRPAQSAPSYDPNSEDIPFVSPYRGRLSYIV